MSNTIGYRIQGIKANRLIDGTGLHRTLIRAPRTDQGARFTQVSNERGIKMNITRFSSTRPALTNGDQEPEKHGIPLSSLQDGKKSR